MNGNNHNFFKVQNKPQKTSSKHTIRLHKRIHERAELLLYMSCLVLLLTYTSDAMPMRCAKQKKLHVGIRSIYLCILLVKALPVLTLRRINWLIWWDIVASYYSWWTTNHMACFGMFLDLEGQWSIDVYGGQESCQI